MTTLRPSGRLLTLHLQINLHASQCQRHASRPALPILLHQNRSYAQKATSTPLRSSPTVTPPQTQSHNDYAKAALTALTTNNASSDPINPSRSTRPPQLSLPNRKDHQNVLGYYFHIGRAYGRFYKDGVKAVWYNRKAANLLSQRISNSSGKDISDLVKYGVLTRAEFQLRVRDKHDIGKLPFFGLLVLIFGEWLPLFVPFMPYAVPSVCRIPKQVEGMRGVVEERRSAVFRNAVNVPGEEQIAEWQRGAKESGATWPIAFERALRDVVCKSLDGQQVAHLGTTLNLYGRIWDRIGIFPRPLVMSRLGPRLQSLGMDDTLLLRQGSAAQVVQALEADEVHIACEERGIDVLGRKDEVLRNTLRDWLVRQHADGGKGVAMMEMLLRRPNAWDDIPGAEGTGGKKK